MSLWEYANPVKFLKLSEKFWLMFAGEVDLKTWYKPKIDKKTLKELSNKLDNIEQKADEVYEKVKKKKKDKKKKKNN